MPSREAVKVFPPPLMLKPARPETPSDAEAVAVTGPEVNQPFEPVDWGRVIARDGADASTWKEVLPDADERFQPPDATTE